MKGIKNHQELHYHDDGIVPHRFETLWWSAHCFEPFWCSEQQAFPGLGWAGLQGAKCYFNPIEFTTSVPCIHQLVILLLARSDILSV